MAIAMFLKFFYMMVENLHFIKAVSLSLPLEQGQDCVQVYILMSRYT